MKYKIQSLKAALCVLMAGAALSAGCGWFGGGVETYVPVKANAAEQYAYAVRERDHRNLALIPLDDKSRYKETREIVRQVFAKVPEYYPEDRKTTPLAKLELAEMSAGLDSPRAGASKRQVRAAIAEFTKLYDAYPEYDFVRAKALYDTGQCELILGNFEKAQNAFYQTREDFKGNADETIRGIAKRADYFYNQTYINGDKEEQKKKEEIRDSPVQPMH